MTARAIRERTEPVTRGATGHVAATNAVATRFFGDNADAIARACEAMAERFTTGGRLLVAGDGAQRSDVAHVVVEFVHPVVVGKRALAALALPEIGGDRARHALATLARRDDLLLVLSGTPLDAAAVHLLATARARGILTVALSGRPAGAVPPADHWFAVLSSDPCIVQETHEMLYHVLWELVHVFFEQPGVLAPRVLG